MVYKDKHLPEYIKFYQGFSSENYLINKNSKESYVFSCEILAEVKSYIIAGYVLELWCWTWMNLSFFKRFSSCSITPFWIDINPLAILYAQKNHIWFENNFLVGDFFDINYDIAWFQTIFLNAFIFEWKKIEGSFINMLSYVEKNLSTSSVFIFYIADDGFYTKNDYTKNITRFLINHFTIIKSHKNFLVLKKKF